MKNYLKLYAKKITAIFLTVLMVLSCWVWVAPEKASAAEYTASTFYWRLWWSESGGQNNGWSHGALTATLYYYYFTGSTRQSGTKSISIPGNTFDIHEKQCWYDSQGNKNNTGAGITGGALNPGEFPYGISFSGKNDNSGNDAEVTFNFDVGTSSTNYNNIIGGNSPYGITLSQSIDTGTGKTANVSMQSTDSRLIPVLTTTTWTTNPNGQTISPAIGGSATKTAELRGYDQYGMQIRGSSSYTLKTTIGGVVKTSDLKSYSYLNSANNTSASAQNSTVTMYAKPIANEALIGTNNGYSMELTGTFTPGCSGNGSAKTNSTKPTVTVNQPKAGNFVFNAQATTNGGVIPSTDHNYGAPSGTVNAKIGNASSLTDQNILYYWELNGNTIPTLDGANLISRTGYTFRYFNNSSTDRNNSSKLYLQEGETIDDTATYGDGVTVTGARTVYGWWEPHHRTVTFVNSDGSQLWKNTNQDFDHQAYYGGATPTYATVSGHSLTYTFGGWINTTTGELVTNISNNLLQGQYVYEDVTYMAYYTAQVGGVDSVNYVVNFDYDGDGIIESADGDFTDSTGNGYYTKVQDSVNVPNLSSYHIPSTGKYDYINPVWVNAENNAELNSTTRITVTPMTFKVKWVPVDVNYSVTLVTGRPLGNSDFSNTTINPFTKGGVSCFKANETGTVSVTNNYKWDDVITLESPGDFADGVYNYEFIGWQDADVAGNPLRVTKNPTTGEFVTYALQRAEGETIMDGIYTDEYIRADGATWSDPATGARENGNKNTKKFYAVYTRTAKTYSVDFLQDNGEPYTGYRQEGEYLAVLSGVVAPVDPTRANTERHSFEFTGWDNVKTTNVVEHYTKAEIESMYDSLRITADALFRPTFDSTEHFFVTFKNYDGTTVTGYTPNTTWYEYGQTITPEDIAAVESGNIARPEETQVYTFEVSGWATDNGVSLVPGTTVVTGDVTYTAQLIQAYQKYDANFYDEDGVTLLETVSAVEYGSRAQKADPTRPASKETSFVFLGWDDMATTSVTENYSAANLPVVHGEQNYRAIFNEIKRPYNIHFMVPTDGGVSYGEGITVNSYRPYTWSDGGVDYTDTVMPVFYYNERISAPRVSPILTDWDNGVVEKTGYTIKFIGWFNEDGEQLSRVTRLTFENDNAAEIAEATTFYARFAYVSLEYSVEYYDAVDAAIPFAVMTHAEYGFNATANANTQAAKLRAFVTEDNNAHYVFDKWVLEDGTPAATALASVSGPLKVYATYTTSAHVFGDYVMTKAPTYFAPGVETNTCSVCGYDTSRLIARLKDETDPTGKIILRNADDLTAAPEAGKLPLESNGFISDYENNNNTVYVPYSDVDVVINTDDIGMGIDKLYYGIMPVSAEQQPYTLADFAALDFEELANNGDITMVPYRNAHFILNGEDGEEYIVYAFASDKAINWTAVDSQGQPTDAVADPHYVYLSAQKVVFDIDKPVIEITNAAEESNADNTVFCSETEISIFDTFLTHVEINGEPVSLVDNTYAATFSEPGTYNVIATDITGKTAQASITINNGHDYDANNDGTDDNYVDFAATCDVAGHRVYTCLVCGKEYEVVTDPALGHDYDQNEDGQFNDDDYVILSQATCEEDGAKAFFCLRCGEEKPDSRVVIPALGHDYSEEIRRVEPTCTIDGYVLYRCANDTTHTLRQVLTAPGHTWDEGVYYDATCTEMAYTLKTCTVCGATDKIYDETHPATGHNLSATSEVVYPANCKHSGLRAYKCLNEGCDYAHYEIIDIDPTMHEGHWETTVYATCLSAGEEKFICDICGENVTDPEAGVAIREIPQEGHDYTDWVEIPATCLTDGSRSRHCRNYTVCGEIETEVIPALGHDMVAGEIVAPTATEGGYTVYTCSRCDYTEHRDFTAPLAPYTITLVNANDNSVIKTLGKVGGNVISVADFGTAPAVTGYTFQKWVCVDDSDVPESITVNSDMTFKAVYDINSYIVTWKNGNDTFETSTVNYNGVPTAPATSPEKAADARYSYTFAGWAASADATVADVTPVFPAVTANVTYYAVYTAEGQAYDVVWKHWNGDILATATVPYGEPATLPAGFNPESVVSTEDENCVYTWDRDWTPRESLITGDTIFTATYTVKPKPVVIYFFADGANTENTAEAYKTLYLNSGDSFIAPAGPAKASDNDNTYAFAGWTPVEGQTVTEPAGATVVAANNGFKYVATYTATPITYSVTFLNENTAVLDTQTGLSYGVAITAPEAPTKAVPAEDAGKYDFVFSGWKFNGTVYAADELPAVSGNMTFTAVFEQQFNTYTVEFKSFDGASTYKTMTVSYGDEISYRGATPYRSKTNESTFQWIGWSTETNSDTALESLGVATADATFYAAFSQAPRAYSVTFDVEGATVTRELGYNSSVAYPLGEEGVPALEKAATAYRTYTFEGWATTEGATVAQFGVEDELPNVTANVTYYAVFSSVINKHSAIWLGADGSELYAQTIDYGVRPVFVGETPAKATNDGVEGANYTYDFVGWVDQEGKTYGADATFDRIIKNMTYTAQFEKVYKLYEVSFMNGDAVLSTKDDYKFGEEVVLADAPANYDEGHTHYVFAGWATTPDATEAEFAAGTAVPAVSANAVYYAVFTSTQDEAFTYTFMNGEDEYASLQVYTGEAVTKPATDPTKVSDDGHDGAEYNYVFLGWSTTDDETAADNIVTDWSQVTASADTTYYAVYEKEYCEYTIKFLTDSGTFISATTYRYGDTVVPAADQVKAATNTTVYTFAGWTADGTTVADFATETVTGSATYRPFFTETVRLYEVKFVDYDGTVIETLSDVEYNTVLTAPAAPTRAEDEGYTYTFAGWTPLVPSKVTKSATYTATYNAVAKNFTVSFFDVAVDGTIGTNAFITQNYTYSQTFVMPSETPARLNTDEFTYTFLGWADYEDPDNTVLTAEDFPAAITANASYKAVYSAVRKTYSVIFKNYDNSVLANLTLEYGARVALADIPTEGLVKPETQALTYSFAGWSKGGAEVYTAAQLAEVAVIGNVVYTAQYTSTAKTFNVKFMNGDTVLSETAYIYDAPVTAPATPTKTVEGETWEFAGWTTVAGDNTTLYASTGIPTAKADVVYYAYFVGGINNYVVTFDVEGVVYNFTYEYNEEFDLDALDINTDKASTNYYSYSFAHWSTVRGGSAATLPERITQPATYYAVYNETPVTHTVTWVVEGQEDLVAEYNYNATIILPAEPTKAVEPGHENDYRYNFLGWSTVEGNALYIETLNNRKVQRDETYYAIFEQEFIKYTVAFRHADNSLISTANYGYGASLAEVAHPTKATVYDNVNFKKTVYTFEGWATTAGGSVAYATSADLPAVTANVTYYSVITAEITDYTPEYTVTFMNGDVQFAVETVLRGEAPAGIANPTRASTSARHFVFTGWTTSESGTGDFYTNTLPEIFADTVFYAKYQAENHNFVENAAESYNCAPGTSTGLKVYYCSVCNHRKAESVPAVHDYEKIEARCVAPGYRADGADYFECRVCHKVDVRTVEKLGMPVTFTVTTEDGTGAPHAIVTVRYENTTIDSATANANGTVTVYVPKVDSTSIIVVSDIGEYYGTEGTVTVIDGVATVNLNPLRWKYCECTCHKTGVWAALFRFLYKILNSLFRSRCCECNTYLPR